MATMSNFEIIIDNSEAKNTYTSADYAQKEVSKLYNY
jgi:hypothetical protein